MSAGGDYTRPPEADEVMAILRRTADLPLVYRTMLAGMMRSLYLEPPEPPRVRGEIGNVVYLTGPQGGAI